jgi:hypothetical protein
MKKIEDNNTLVRTQYIAGWGPAGVQQHQLQGCKCTPLVPAWWLMELGRLHAACCIAVAFPARS